MTNEVAFAVDKLVYDVAPAFEAMCIDRSIVFAREAEFAIQALCASDYALKIARQNPQSVQDAVTNIAAIGISLNPAKKQAYLVPRKGGICLVISYMGLLDLAIQSGSILWGQAELVYAADKFTMHGYDQPPTHERNPFLKDRGELVGAYTVVKTKDGDYLTTTMTAEEVFAIRDRSDAWIAYKKDESKKCPWVTDQGEMVKKTVIKRAYKLWPKTDKDRLSKAIHYLNSEGGEGLTEAANEPAEPAKSMGSSARDAMREALTAMSIESQNYMRELAGEVEAIFRNPEAGVVSAFDRIEIESLDQEGRMALWYLLPSDVRSALKKEGDARRAA